MYTINELCVLERRRFGLGVGPEREHQESLLLLFQQMGQRLPGGEVSKSLLLSLFDWVDFFSASYSI